MQELPIHCINLKAFRSSLNMYQNEMAAKLGVSKTLYRDVEKGRINPTYYFLERFVKAFPDVNLNKFFFDVDIFKLYM